MDDDRKGVDEHERKHHNVETPERTHPPPQVSNSPLTPTRLPPVTVIGSWHDDTPGYFALMLIDTVLHGKVPVSNVGARLVVPGQTVDATPSNALIR